MLFYVIRSLYGHSYEDVRRVHSLGLGQGLRARAGKRPGNEKNHLRSCSIRESLLLRSVASNNGALICLICFALIAIFTKNCFTLQIHALITCFPFTSCKTFIRCFCEVVDPLLPEISDPELKEFDTD